MAIKTFTTGEVLTSSDTNTYLANSGLVYITSSPFTAVSSKQVEGCFNSSFSHYQIIVNLTATSTGNQTLKMNMVTGTTPDISASYYGNLIQRGQTGAVTNNDVNGGTAWTINGWATSTGSTVCNNNITLYSPNLAIYTSYSGTGVTNINDLVNTTNFGGACATSSQYTGFKLTPSSGTMHGAVYVYGLQQP